ncbi:MAG: hypothetical protein KJ052_15590 [Candidatus Hydrogenedentes bacterium]|nr:hypothetical protein [Candidatus Hydrogenedentota bacterium]
MPLASCARCRKLFGKEDRPICQVCIPDEEADYDTVRAALDVTPSQSARQLAKSTDVDLDCIMRLIAEGRIAVVELLAPAVCGQCGAPAISSLKRLCQKCLSKLTTQEAKDSRRVKTGEGKPIAAQRRSSIAANLEERKQQSAALDKRD